MSVASNTAAPTTSAPAPAAGADFQTGDQDFDAYTEALSTGQTLLGHLVLYSVLDDEVTVELLTQWFDELSLDKRYLPPPLRQVDAFERATGSGGVKASYALPDHSGPTSIQGAAANTAAAPPSKRARNSRDADRSASLMVRPVRRDGELIERHVVREVRDVNRGGGRGGLDYDVRLAACIFRRNNNAGAQDGDGALEIVPEESAIAALDPEEQTAVRELLAGIEEEYRRRCLYLSADRLRMSVRTYLEDLKAIKVRPTGGVYFVHREHATTLAALRELISRFGEGSQLARIPLADQDEMREMVIQAFTSKAKEDLDRLAQDIAAARRDGRYNAATKLYNRFAELAQTTEVHSAKLSTSLEDTQAALALVKVQLGSLLTAAPDEDAAPEGDSPAPTEPTA